MNRQQRRSRNKLTRAEWSLRLVELQKTTPGLPGDLETAQLLMGIIVDEQLNISDMNLATLAGLCCGHMARAMKEIPPATHADKNGTPMFTDQQVAEFTGMPVEEVRASITAYFKEIGVEPSNQGDVFPLH